MRNQVVLDRAGTVEKTLREWVQLWQRPPAVLTDNKLTTANRALGLHFTWRGEDQIVLHTQTPPWAALHELCHAAHYRVDSWFDELALHVREVVAHEATLQIAPDLGVPLPRLATEYLDVHEYVRDLSHVPHEKIDAVVDFVLSTVVK